MQPAEQYLVTPQTSEQLNREAAALARLESDSVKELEGERARYYITPHTLSLIAYFILSVVLLLALNYQTIILGFNDKLVLNGTLTQSVQSQVSLYADNAIVGYATLILFWGMVGLGAYTLYWLVMAFFTAARNELIVETAFSNRGHFWDKVKVPMIKLTFLGCIGGMVLLILRVIAPVISDLFVRAITNIFTASLAVAGLEIVVCILGFMFAMHVLWSLIQIFHHADGIF